MPKKTKHPPKKGADPAPYRFTEPVVRVLSDKKNGKFGPRGKTEAGQSSGPKPRVAVFHKRKDKSVNANVIGTRNLSVWKKSSGRSKSWKACKRLKLTQGYLELLTNSNGHSVSFGWRFSTTKTPTSFVRGQRIYVNKKPKPRCTEKSSGALILKELDEEDKKGFPLPRGRPYKGKWRVGQESQQEVALTELPKRFFRVFVGPSTFSKTEESFPGRVTFATRQSLPVLVHNPEFQNDITPRDFVILDLVHNDSLADVYLVQKFEDSSWSYYAHVFLNEGFGNNWRRYRQRKMDRMRQSNDFQAEMVQFNKHIIVMKASSEVDNAFHFKNTQLEFPPLPGSAAKPYKPGPKRYRRSYAAVLKSQPPPKKKPVSNHRAYRAWQERRGIQKPKTENITTPQNLGDGPETKLEDFTVVSCRRKPPKFTHLNPFDILEGARN